MLQLSVDRKTRNAYKFVICGVDETLSDACRVTTLAVITVVADCDRNGLSAAKSP
jgi:hypothetical protein